MSFDGLSESFHVPDSTNVWRQERSTLRAQHVRRNARRKNRWVQLALKTDLSHKHSNGQILQFNCAAHRVCLTSVSIANYFTANIFCEPRYCRRRKLASQSERTVRHTHHLMTRQSPLQRVDQTVSLSHIHVVGGSCTLPQVALLATFHR